MRHVIVDLKSAISKSFRCVKAAQSQDIDVEKKSTHHKELFVDVDSPYSIGVIVGSSGSGKTTLARQLFGSAFSEDRIMDPQRPVIDQFPEGFTYDQCQRILCDIGLSSVPCWIRPASTLSNGQRFRAEVALSMAKTDGITIIDEWTSVVDRTVAKVMSHCVQKHARRENKQVVLLSCHYDVLDWLQPDWIIDCNTDTFTCRRSLPKTRTEQLQFEVRECDKKYWKMFSKYHYLSENLCGGSCWYFGIFEKETNTICGFGAYSSYVPGNRFLVHSNRVVIHPDYCGIGLAQRFVNITAAEMKRRGFRVMEKNSSKPRWSALKRDPRWKLLSSAFKTSASESVSKARIKTKRDNVRFCIWEFIG
jgi:ABC-type dipeptide/oligopeptide/nickel transport system ATPase subunit